MKIKTKIFFTTAICLIIIANKSEAQQNSAEIQKQPAFDKSRITLGGDFGLALENNSTIIKIAPQVGYLFTPQLHAGGGLSYSYYRYKASEITSKSHYTGLNLFGQFHPLPYAVLHAQPEVNYMSRSYGNRKDSDFIPSFVVGVGAYLNAVRLMLQYDIVQDKNSPYGDNIFYSVGVTF